MKKYEYKELSIIKTNNYMDKIGSREIYVEDDYSLFNNENIYSVEQILNYYGRIGWKVIKVYDVNEKYRGTSRNKYFLEREICSLESICKSSMVKSYSVSRKNSYSSFKGVR